MTSVEKAVGYYRRHGLRGFLKRTVQKFGRKSIQRHEVDEVGIAIKAFNIQGFDGVMIDVGAHHGNTSQPFCAAGWHVYAFEPDSLNRETLKAKLGPQPKLMVDKRALSNTESESATFFRSAQSTGISGLSAFHSSHVAAETVAVTTLAQIINENNIRRIDFLKIDTEGFDKFVLEGLPWATHQPTVIVTEFEDHKTRPLGYNFQDYADFLVAKGYEVMVSEWSPVQAYGVQHDWLAFKVYPCRLNSEHAWGNLIASNDAALFRRVTAECESVRRKVK